MVQNNKINEKKNLYIYLFIYLFIIEYEKKK